MHNKKFTLSETLKLLEIYALSEELNESPETNDTEDSCYTHDYDDYIDSTADNIRSSIFISDDGTTLEQKSAITVTEELQEDKSPEIGDIAVLKIKLNNHKKDKFIYDGYERRPILIIKVHNKSLVDALEITHSDTFKHRSLINIGKIGKDSRDSYVNIFRYYSNLDTNYEFPIEFKDGKPISKGEYSLQYFGKVYKGKNKDEPFLVGFDYNYNYKETIDMDTLCFILSVLRKNQELSKK